MACDKEHTVSFEAEWGTLFGVLGLGVLGPQEDLQAQPPHPPPEARAHQKPALFRLSALLSSPSPSPSVFPGSQSTALKRTWKIKTLHELSQNSRATLRPQACPWPELGLQPCCVQNSSLSAVCRIVHSLCCVRIVHSLMELGP